jgi:hypothetical protein
MGYIICMVVTAFISFKLGRVYTDFQDLMIARRVSKIVMQRDQIQKEQTEYEKSLEIDYKMSRIKNKKIELEEEMS